MLYDPSIRKRILESAKRADFNDLLAFLTDPKISLKDKLDELQSMKENEDWRKSAGAVGKYIGEQDIIRNFAQVSPLEVIPQGKPVPMPIIITSDQARNQFNENLQMLQRYENQFQNQFQNTQSTPPFAPKKPKPNMTRVV